MTVPLPSFRNACLLATILAGTAIAPWAAAQSGSGLRWPDPAWQGPAGDAGGGGSAWKGRIGVGYGGGLSAARLEAADFGADAPQPDSLRLLGDYYFSRKSGFRATGGLLRGSIGSPWMLTGSGTVAMGWSRQAAYAPGSGMGLRASSAEGLASTVPYVGAGYSFDLPQTWGGDWSFSADVGMVAVGPGVRLGRGYVGQSLDDAVREMRLRPVLQLGVSYSF